LVEETRGPRKNQRPVASPRQTLSTDTRFNNITKAYFNHEIITGNFVVSTWCIDDMFSGDRTKFGDFSGHLLFVKFYSDIHVRKYNIWATLVWPDQKETTYYVWPKHTCCK
jgi:hypothetical protein